MLQKRSVHEHSDGQVHALDSQSTDESTDDIVDTTVIDDENVRSYATSISPDKVNNYQEVCSDKTSIYASNNRPTQYKTNKTDHHYKIDNNYHYNNNNFDYD